jgi:SAM-dependent methyltransferase
VKRNVVYQTDQLVRYFARNRVAWSQFYESERVIINRLNLDSRCTILDIGCGCGGLGLALRERFGVEDYTGVEINSSAAEAGRALNPAAHILCGDILDLCENEIRERRFNVVFSLSCVDWNVRFADMLSAAWSRVLPGGHLVATFRLIDAQGCNDLEQSYQYINFDGKREGERASYVVLNARNLIQELVAFDPSEINAFGYWGVPSVTAVTPYEQLCFSAFSIRKRSGDTGVVRLDLNLPAEIQAAMGFSNQ